MFKFEAQMQSLILLHGTVDELALWVLWLELKLLCTNYMALNYVNFSICLLRLIP
jgi:hypothetical protein